MAQFQGKKEELQGYKKIVQVAGGWIPVLNNHLIQPPLAMSNRFNCY
jgi:hypothetical protein